MTGLHASKSKLSDDHVMFSLVLLNFAVYTVH